MSCSKVIGALDVPRNYDRPGLAWMLSTRPLLRRPDYVCEVTRGPGHFVLRIPTWKDWEYWLAVPIALIICVAIDRSFSTPAFTDHVRAFVISVGMLAIAVGIIKGLGSWHISVEDRGGACELRFRSLGVTWRHTDLGNRWRVLVHPCALSRNSRTSEWHGMALALHASSGTVVIGAFGRGDAQVQFADTLRAMGVDGVTIGMRLVAKY